MYMNAVVIGSDVVESSFYDKVTGVPKPQWVLEMEVLDGDTREKYTVQVTEGFTRLDELKEAKRQGVHPDQLRAIADVLRNELPPNYTQLQLQVLKLKGKQVAFLKLVCRLVTAPVAA